MAGRKANGEGSIYRRGDGRYAGSAFVDTTDGRRKRIHVYGASRQEVHDRLADKLALARKGIRTPEKDWTVGSYLDYWLSTVVAVKNRPRTAELYESTVRVHLTPRLGKIRLTKLTVADVQRLLNEQLASGHSVRTLHRVRTVLRAALSRAEREELVLRNVAKLVDIPAWERKPIKPWNRDEAALFLDTAKGHRWYAGYLMLLVYGMRRGEVLGLRWCDVDFHGDQIRIRQQLQRIGSTLQQGPVKTAAGRRDLPLIAVIKGELQASYQRRHGALPEAELTDDDPIGRELVLLSSTGTPIDPKNFVRAFHELRDQAGLPRITVHHTRHTAATMLKNLGVPARDAQLILGHSHVTTTQQLYQHGDLEGQTKALAQVERELLSTAMTAAVAVKTAVKPELSTGESTIFRALTPGGPGGARTLDTLLKSLLTLDSTSSPTPVIRRLRTRAYAHVLGRVAVKYCCQSPGPDSLPFGPLILHALRRVEGALLRERSFPLNLLPAAGSLRATGPPAAPSPTDPSSEEGRAA